MTDQSNHAPPAIDPDRTVAAILDKWPETLQVFLRHGFTPLADPELRRQLAHTITVRQAADSHGVDLESLLADLSGASVDRAGKLRMTENHSGGSAMTDLHNERARPEGETSATAERVPQQVVGPLLTFGLDHEIAVLRREDAWEHGNHNAKTLVKGGDLRVILVVMKDGAKLPEHHAPNRIAIQVLAGRLRVTVPWRSIDLNAGSLLTLEGGLTHDVEALEESSFLLTIGWTGNDSHPLEPGARTPKSDAAGATLLDVRMLAPAQRHQQIFQSFIDLAPGSAFILVNDHDPKPLYYQFAHEHAGQFTWDYLEEGPEVWRVRIGKTG